jgi:uncharacterized protein
MGAADDRTVGVGAPAVLPRAFGSGRTTEALHLAPVPSAVVLQPTTLCNLNCNYCYLPQRSSNLMMDPAIAESVAASIQRWAPDRAIEIVWHGGEPLSCGRKRFEVLLAKFEQLRRRGLVHHTIQTNATLVSDKWCDLFNEFAFTVGVSIDGPAWANKNRLDLRDHETFQRTLAGIERLRERNIPFSTITVIGNVDPTKATELYEFLVGIGSTSLAFNVEEVEGVNLRRELVHPNNTKQFWLELLKAWHARPVVRIREFGRAFNFVDSTLRGSEDPAAPLQHQDYFPTVAWNGDVVLLSPELAGSEDARYGNFVAGNVLSAPLQDILLSAHDLPYITEFLGGVAACRRECAYFDFCGGGQPANKYFEHGSFGGTETLYCRNTRQALMMAVLAFAEAIDKES